MIKKKQDDWDHDVEKTCWSLRSSSNEKTEHIPYEKMCLRKPRTKSELPMKMPVPDIPQEPTCDKDANYVKQKSEVCGN